MSDLQAAPLAGLQEQWKLSQAQDDQKHSLITNLFAYLDRVSRELSEAKSEIVDKKDAMQTVRNRAEESAKQAQDLQLEKARHVFAFVIIDGDCLLFKDELVKLGKDGGRKAANLLKQAVQEELKSSVPTAITVPIVIRVYANVKGLSRTYSELGIPTFDEFIQGFNMLDVMCDYTDAGNGKECADEKVKANFRHHLADMHCQQVLFGGTADNGYARLLEPYAEDGAARGRITLLEGPPFARELAAIKDRFRTASFDNVFRSQKLPDHKLKFPSYITPPATPTVDYASAATKGLSAPVPPLATQSVSTPSRALVSQQVLRNKQGQRVDSVLKYSKTDFIYLKGRKLCNSFHLLGACCFEACSHEHGERLNPNQTEALRAVARHSPCQHGLYCQIPDCISGHRCIWNSCNTATCRFPLAMHNVDTKIVT